MAGYKIQLKDKNGNRQYPVTTTNVVVDADGVSVADLLDRKQPTLVSGVNIKTVNGKTLLGEGDLVIEGGTADLSGYATTEYVDAKVGESYPIYYSLDGVPLTEEQKAANKMAVDRYAADESVILYPCMSSLGYPFDVLLTIDQGVWTKAELRNHAFILFDDEGTAMAYIQLTMTPDGDIQANIEDSAKVLTLASHAYVDSKVGSGLKYFVERYVYAGDTEEEKTYNLESLAMAEQGVDILWAGIYNASVGDTAGSWYERREYDAFVAEAHAYIDSESGILVMEDTSFCRDLRYGSFDVGYDDEREWLVAFFKRDNWAYERAYYGPFPIISWSEESNTVLRAYYLANGLAIAYVSVNIETGEVSQPVVGQ